VADTPRNPLFNPLGDPISGTALGGHPFRAPTLVNHFVEHPLGITPGVHLLEDTPGVPWVDHPSGPSLGTTHLGYPLRNPSGCPNLGNPAGGQPLWYHT
jgi:hypothetical protein